MCTNPELFGVVSWYSVWIVIGILLCLFTFDRLCAYKKITAEANRFYYLLGVVSIVIGFLCAGLVQSTYNYIAELQKHPTTAKWEWGGITFMGGLYGGALTFVVASLIFAKGNVRAQFGQICEIAIPCIPIAHCFGRIGCFAAGCCYGAKVHEGDLFGWLGVAMPQVDGAVRYPVQLFESFFLAILAVVLVLLVIKDKKINVVVYFAAYGIFRFFIEFLRDDARGSVGVQLSPSQVSSIISVIIALLMLTYILLKKYKPSAALAVRHAFKLDVEFVPEPVGAEPLPGEESAEKSSEQASSEPEHSIQGNNTMNEVNEQAGSEAGSESECPAGEQTETDENPQNGGEQ